MGKEDTLGLGGDDVVIFRCLCQQITGAGNGQLLVTEDYETCNIQIVIYLTDRQLPLQSCHGHRIYHKYCSFIQDTFIIKQEKGMSSSLGFAQLVRHTEENKTNHKQKGQ